MCDTFTASNYNGGMSKKPAVSYDQMAEWQHCHIKVIEKYREAVPSLYAV